MNEQDNKLTPMGQAEQRVEDVQYMLDTGQITGNKRFEVEAWIRSENKRLMRWRIQKAIALFQGEQPPKEAA